MLYGIAVGQMMTLAHDMGMQRGARLVWMDAGLERLQQLMDAMVDDGLTIRQHIYRVRNARDAHYTVQRHRSVDRRLDETSKHILVDLPTKQCEQFLKLQVLIIVTS